MSKKVKPRTIPIDTVVDSLEQGLAGTDTARKQDFQGLQQVRLTKANSQERERLRLSRKLGQNHPRVQALDRRINYNQGLIRDIQVEIDHAVIDVPDVNENAWTVHGFVRKQDLTGVPGLTVALYDEKGNWIKQLGYACTDRKGYFRLTHGRDEDQPLEGPAAGATIRTNVSRKRQVFLRVLDQDSNLLYCDNEPLVPQLGKLDYREIVLGEDATTCKPPENGEQPPPGPSPIDPSGPDVDDEGIQLEKIPGIGPGRAQKLREAGILDARIFSETDNEKLKEILGSVDIKKMKKQAKQLLG